MITIEKTDIYGWGAAIRGMRNPMNSWEKSDSKYCCVGECCGDECGYDKEKGIPCLFKDCFILGKNDLSLMKRLSKAGSDHRKFMRFVTVTVDITAPLYWWKEFDTYKVGTVANSCSTMHKIAAKEFTLADFSYEHLNRKSLYMLNDTIQYLNGVREAFLKTQDKDYWWQMIQLLPSSYNQKRTVQLNYEVLKNIYNARKNHKLNEWRDFCEWIEKLPYSELITENEEGEKVES